MIIFYFSGTGNSLWVARGIANKLGNPDVVNIAKCVFSEEYPYEDDIIGLVFPVYFENMPSIVQQFVKKLKLGPKIYVFAVVTCGSGPGLALDTLDKLLKENNSKLSSGFFIKMPDNMVIIVNLIPPLAVQNQILKDAEKVVNEIADIIRRKKYTGYENKKKFKDKLEGRIMKLITTKIFRTPRKFKVTEKCVKCGICISICPTNNIQLGRNQVLWGNNCIQCLACLHWCPNQAIYLGKSSQNLVRYHHPAINIKEMILR